MPTKTNAHQNQCPNKPMTTANYKREPTTHHHPPPANRKIMGAARFTPQQEAYPPAPRCSYNSLLDSNLQYRPLSRFGTPARTIANRMHLPNPPKIQALIPEKNM
jgi:hypothetical protein